jgi:hypothetical protein
MRFDQSIGRYLSMIIKKKYFMKEAGNGKLNLVLLIISVLCIFQLFSIINVSNDDNLMLRIYNRNLKDEHYISTFTYDRVDILLDKVNIMDKSIRQLYSNKNKMTREDYDNQMQEIHLELNGIEDVLKELKINFEY